MEILKAETVKLCKTYTGTNLRMTVDFVSEIIQVRGMWTSIYKY